MLTLVFRKYLLNMINEENIIDIYYCINNFNEIEIIFFYELKNSIA
jgi:hypothetical protein